MYATPEQAILVTLGIIFLFGLIVAVMALIQDWQEAQKKQQVLQHKRA